MGPGSAPEEPAPSQRHRGQDAPGSQPARRLCTAGSARPGGRCAVPPWSRRGQRAAAPGARAPPPRGRTPVPAPRSAEAQEGRGPGGRVWLSDSGRLQAGGGAETPPGRTGLAVQEALRAPLAAAPRGP
ncbi:PREDICTED: translation initiation factor IF-2-like, partial [Chinchilla lanigera]|uniref:translation initiation factor IF-2-like n=1 Tax=Chinchilla lanigera TaxID=34839 RepID=UPI000697C912